MDVCLRPVTDDDLPLLAARRRRVPEDEPFDWFGFTDGARPPVTATAGTLVVEVDGVPAGDVGRRPVEYGLAATSSAVDEIEPTVTKPLRGHSRVRTSDEYLGKYQCRANNAS